MVLKDKGRTPRKQRATRYGLPAHKEAAVSKKATQYTKAVAQVVKAKSAPVFAPISDEITPYGAVKFRTPTSHKQYSGFQGSAQLACVLDIDGTMQTWGAGLDKDLADWCAKLYKKYPDIVFLIVTARDHEWMYETSFNWVMRAFPYAFIGPFCRAKDDPRYASEFKRELCQGFEDMGLYQIVAAADDNEWVIKMWKHWAIEHFEDPTDFELMECDSYDSYLGWRGDLPKKGYSSYSSGYVSGTPVTSTYGPKKEGQVWCTGGYDNTGTWVSGGWFDPDKKPQGLFATKADALAKNRPAGTSRYDQTAEPEFDLTNSAAWAHYLAARYGSHQVNKPGSWPSGGLNVVSESPVQGDPLDEVIDVIEAPTALYRQDLEDIVAHQHPTWTPVKIADMTTAQLRAEVGIADDDYREMIYDQIANLFGSRVCDDELDELDLETVESMLDMTKEEIDFALNQAWQERQHAQVVANASSPTGASGTWMPEQAPAGMSDEEFARRKARIDLEDLVMNLYGNLALTDVEAMDSAELQEMVLQAEAAHAAAQADEAQVMGVEGGVAS